jgi:hypothetical protein
MEFYDLAFMNYIIMHFRDASVLTHCARLISWLPYSGRAVNFLCAEAVARRDIGLEQSFVLYQLERVRLLRESSASTTAAEKLTSVRTHASETSLMMRGFWDRSECSIALLNRFAALLSSTDSLWQEAIEDFPNSVQFRDVYITYLIEGATRFSEAVFQKSRADMIENGVDFRVDNCFRRFVGKFPEYLKRSILDAKGSLLKRARKIEQMRGSSGVELSGGLPDIGLEEGIGTAIIMQARVRLTLERAFEGRRASSFSGVVLLAVCMGALVFLDQYFDARRRRGPHRGAGVRALLHVLVRRLLAVRAGRCWRARSCRRSRRGGRVLPAGPGVGASGDALQRRVALQLRDDDAVADGADRRRRLHGR